MIYNLRKIKKICLLKVAKLLWPLNLGNTESTLNLTLPDHDNIGILNYSLNDFRGGAELLFDKKKKHQVNLPGDDCKFYKFPFV